MDKNKIISLNCSFMPNSIEKLNSQFSKVKIRIAYWGKNRNRTYFSKELLEDMAKTSLKNIPIVGFWREDTDNFGGHDIEIKQTGNKTVVKDLTRPYGVVPSDAETWWELVREKDGYTTNEYLCTTGILWSGRYEEIEKILTDGSNQSMEISLIDGEYDEEDYFHINKAEFSALCILGKDSDPDKNVEPCFESAIIQPYNLDTFKQEYSKMLDELNKFSKKISKSSKGVSGMELSKEMRDAILGEYGVSAEDVDFYEADLTESEFRAKAEKVRLDNLLSSLDVFKEENENLRNQVETLNNSINELNSELDELKEFKAEVIKNEHKEEVDSLLEEFSEIENVEEFKALKKDAYSYEDISLLKEKCFAIYGKALKDETKNMKEKGRLRYSQREFHDDNFEISNEEREYADLF